jgi:molybdopterin-guanine dinucleotide biosynthesis protein A
MKISVGILIGGRSRRMGHPKALIPIENTTLLERTVGIARGISDDILLIGRPAFTLPQSLSSLEVVPDRHADPGPIGGLLALLAQRPGHACILLACDMPYIRKSLLRRLSDAEGEFDAAVCRTRDPAAESQGRWHPCCGLYRASSLPIIESAIAARRYEMNALLAELRVLPIELTGGEVRAVENWNKPSDIGSPPSE